jgi:hypothetical protein
MKSDPSSVKVGLQKANYGEVTLFNVGNSFSYDAAVQEVCFMNAILHNQKESTSWEIVGEQKQLIIQRKQNFEKPSKESGKECQKHRSKMVQKAEKQYVPSKINYSFILEREQRRIRRETNRRQPFHGEEWLDSNTSLETWILQVSFPHNCTTSIQLST